jgi:hypothetical protein
MRTAAKVFFVATAAVGCLAFATLAINCGGSSGERPGGSGGTTSTGGAGNGGTTGGGGAIGTGGTTTAGSTTTAGLNCASPVVPANVSNGGVTDFTDYTAQGKWGSSTGLYGAVYAYPGTKGSTLKSAVEGTPKGLHLTGSVMANDYSGGGLSFYVCATVASFTQVRFDIVGTSPGCDLELQIQTFDQRPTTQTPAGGCNSATTSCYGFPVVKKVAVPSATSATITTPLASFSTWSATNAAQVVGLQWQFTGTLLDPDASVGCPIDVTITNIKFQ